MDRFIETRPYNDEEVPAAIQRIVNNPTFPLVVSYVKGDMDELEFVRAFSQIRTVERFQVDFMYPAVKSVIKNTITNLIHAGFENFDDSVKRMFVSNHRDIALDSALLELLLHEYHADTTEITFGDNLMHWDLVVDLGKLNKMFRIVRGGNMRDFYRNSMEVSSYMRYAITEKKQSVWIAQRNGRTKNGDDRTEVGVLKMFSLSSDKPFFENMKELNITPLSISYEYEPCDFLKASEEYVSSYMHYEKSSNEDLNSILKGIMQPKGRVHLAITQAITDEELAYCDSFPKNEKFARLAEIVDERVYRNYRLYPNNYIAHDLLYGENRYQSYYTTEEKNSFSQYMQEGLAEFPYEKCEFSKFFLQIYANPVEHCHALSPTVEDDR